MVRCTLINLKRRFNKYFSFDLMSNARYGFLASMSHPFYKLRFLNGTDTDDIETKCNALKRCIISEMKRHRHRHGPNSDSVDNEPTPPNSNLNDVEKDELSKLERFYCFDEVPETIYGDDVEVEFQRYLSDSKITTIPDLNNYPNIREVFRHYNTIIPSSAPVERVFSVAKHILRPERNKLKDELFEKLIILKSN